jgi:hypothetical protein
VCLLRGTFCPHSVFICFVWIWEQTAIISPYSINWLVFITETECVYCAVRAEFLNIIRVTAFKMLKGNTTECNFLLSCMPNFFMLFAFPWKSNAAVRSNMTYRVLGFRITGWKVAASQRSRDRAVTSATSVSSSVAVQIVSFYVNSIFHCTQLLKQPPQLNITRLITACSNNTALSLRRNFGHCIHPTPFSVRVCS